MLTQKTLTLDEAMRAVNAAIDYAKSKDHVGIAVFVVDKNGNAIVSARMDNRSDRFYRSAHRKAYSAAIFERDTSAIIDLHDRLDEEGHRGPMEWNDPMLTTLPAGYVVMAGDEVLGAISVAGGSRGDVSDVAIADVAFAALGEGYHHQPGQRGHA
jgi:uncharacterized protein GlcG (DUF336 family)